MSDHESNGHMRTLGDLEPPTLRDLFASNAVVGLASGIGDPLVAEHEAANIARAAYVIADAMMVERRARGSAGAHLDADEATT